MIYSFLSPNSELDSHNSLLITKEFLSSFQNKKQSKEKEGEDYNSPRGWEIEIKSQKKTENDRRNSN